MAAELVIGFFTQEIQVQVRSSVLLGSPVIPRQKDNNGSRPCCAGLSGLDQCEGWTKDLCVLIQSLMSIRELRPLELQQLWCYKHWYSYVSVTCAVMLATITQLPYYPAPTTSKCQH